MSATAAPSKRRRTLAERLETQTAQLAAINDKLAWLRRTLAERLETQTAQLAAINDKLAWLERELDRALRAINPYALTALRERSGYSKTALAREAGTSVGHMSDIESGRRNPSPKLLGRIAAALKVPVAALLAHPADEADR